MRFKIKFPTPSSLLKSISVGYRGPMSVADITLESWNQYFSEGGTLNQPSWLQNSRLKQIKKNFEMLARYHGA